MARATGPSGQNGGMSASVTSWILHEIQHLSPSLVYVLVGFLVFGEAALFIGFVLPGETSVLVAGVVASQGRVHVTVLLGLVVAAAIVGDTVGYAVGHRWGHQIIASRPFRARQAALTRAMEGLRRRGPLYVFLGRFTAFLRAVMPGLAGMSKVKYRHFLAANAAGGVVWGVGFTLLGYYAGNALGTIEHYASWASGLLLALFVVALVTWHYVRKSRERRQPH